jgi:hypothetical protein
MTGANESVRDARGTLGAIKVLPPTLRMAAG